MSVKTERSIEVGFYPISTAASKGYCLNSVLLFSHYQSKAPIQPQLIYSFIKDKCVVFQFHFVEGCGKTAVQQAVYNTICLKYTGGPLIERRRAKRFQVDWQIRVEGNDGNEGGFVERGVLRNISSSGALLSLTNALPAGTQLDVYIKLPLKGKKWMKYPARVVRIELGAAAVTAAVRFDSARPDFGMPLVPM